MTRFNSDILVFPKFCFPHLGVEQLADWAMDCGFDGVDVMIRQASWVKDTDYFDTLPKFASEMRRRNLKAYTATTDWLATEIDAIEKSYKLFADNGITMFRFLMQNYRGIGSYDEDFEHCRKILGRIEALGIRYGVKALLQTHGGSLVWCPAAVHHMVRGFDPKAIGIHLDPGNLWHQEGWTEAPKMVDIVRKHLAYVAVKNPGWFYLPDPGRDQQFGWRREWTPLGMGLVNWRHVLDALLTIGFDGPFCMHNFYESSMDGLTAGTKANLALLRDYLAAAKVIAKA